MNIDCANQLLTQSSDATQLLVKALESVLHSLVIVDICQSDQPIIYANAAFEKTTQYSVEETLGRNCRFLHGQDTDQPGLDELRLAVKEGRDCVVTLRNYKRDGSMFINELHVTPVFTGKQLTHFIGIQKDVTSETNNKLIAQRRQVEDFMSTLSHDLKVPLIGAGRIMSQLLANNLGVLTPGQKLVIEQLNNANQAQIDFIENILKAYFSTLASNQLAVSCDEINKFINSYVENINSQSTHSSNKVVFDYQLSVSTMTIMVDINAIETLVKALIDLIYHLAPKSGSVKLITSVSQNSFELIFESKTLFIPAPRLKRLFKQFWIREDRYAPIKGIGPQLIQKIIEAHHGDLRCSSNQSDGTVFAIILPKI